MTPATRYLNTASQALDRARSRATWSRAMCMNFVWDCFTSGRHRYGVDDAMEGWSRTRQRRYDRFPPAGVPVYWSSRKQPHGHVAISLGGGRVRSTDWPLLGKVGDVAISEIERKWELHYLGWGLDLFGDAIPGVYPPAPVLRRGTRSPIVKHLQAELLRVFPSYARQIATNGGPNGLYGPATERTVREFQRRVDIRVDGIVGASTWAQLAKFGIRAK